MHKWKFGSENDIHFPAVYGLFNDSASILRYTVSNGRIIHDRFERILKEVILAE